MDHTTRKNRIIFASLLVFEIIVFISLAQAHGPNYADCMKNPFASGCRGISAKRSPPQASTFRGVDGELTTGELSPSQAPTSRQRLFTLADLLRQQRVQPTEYSTINGRWLPSEWLLPAANIEQLYQVQ